MNVFTIGQDIAIVSLPGEDFVELGLAIKQGSPFRTTIVIELSNCVESIYVPTRAAYAGAVTRLPTPLHSQDRANCWLNQHYDCSAKRRLLHMHPAQSDSPSTEPETPTNSHRSPQTILVCKRFLQENSGMNQPSASQLASITFSLTPIVPHTVSPSVLSIDTRTFAAVFSAALMTRTL